MICDACESISRITGRAEGTELMKNVNHSKNNSLLIHLLGESLTTAFGRESCFRVSFHGNPLKIIKVGIHVPLAHTHPKSEWNSPRSEYALP
jgi:hypothetical protein